MNRILIDENKSFYKGNMHCHSTLSDGKYTPEKLKEIYKREGYSFLALTDHEVVRDNSYLDDSDFITITSSEYAIKEFPMQSTLKNYNMRVCHLNIYAKEQHNAKTILHSVNANHFCSSEEKGELIEKYGDVERPYSADTINNIIKVAEENGFFVAYNHPRWSLENYAQYSKYEGLWGVEIYNHGVSCNGIYEYDINVFDDFLRDGKRVFASCGDDNHNDSGEGESFGAFVMVNTTSLSYKNIIDALLSGDFYSSTGPMIYSLIQDGNKVKIKCSDAKMITLSTKGRYSRSVVCENDGYLNEAEFEIRDDSEYFRLDVIDENGKRANTQAYYI